MFKDFRFFFYRLYCPRIFARRKKDVRKDVEKVEVYFKHLQLLIVQHTQLSILFHSILHAGMKVKVSVE